MRAYSFRAALNDGLEPRAYQDELPVGTFKARLDFKIWAKTPVLRCFFTDADGRRFTLIACHPKDGSRRYTPKDGVLDISVPEAAGKWYALTTCLNSKGNTAWLTATEIESPLPDGAA
jgi:hypothetical protein